jgi:hypothetical protein
LLEIGALQPISLADPERALRWIEYAEDARCFTACRWRWRWRSIPRGIQRLRSEYFGPEPGLPVAAPAVLAGLP